ncbi:hypothetical protein NEF64_18850 (plasmid) [Sphingomonas aerolata]|nr:hypothetical protein [Sphingomonas aerolata]USR02371.1 hypothetical protein NEF64_18850 [Sphingomonas aerolata]
MTCKSAGGTWQPGGTTDLAGKVGWGSQNNIENDSAIGGPTGGESEYQPDFNKAEHTFSDARSLTEQHTVAYKRYKDCQQRRQEQ